MTTATPAAPIKGTPFRGRIRGRVLVLLCCMYAISYIDRTNISTALPHITEEFGFNEATAGLIVSAFSLPYALLQVFGGTISEKFGPRRALFVITVIWGVATLWTGFAVGFWTLFAARALLGLSEAAAFPTATQAMSRWIPRDRNGFAQGVVHSAARLGNALAPLIVAWVIGATGSWRWAFFATAVLSLAWAVVWFVWFRDKPESAKGITQVELAELPPVETRATRPPVPWRQMAKQILPVTFVDFGYGWTLWVFLTWLPTFLSSTYGLEIGDFALFTTLILLAGVVGDTVGGMLSDRIIHRGGNTRNARRTILVIGLGGSLLCLIPLVIGQGLLVATISLALSFFFLELCNANLWAIPMDVAPQWSGTASGFMNTGFGIAGVVSPIVFGLLIDASGWQLPFALSCVLLGAAAVVAWFMKPQRLTSTDGVLEIGTPKAEQRPA
ncbi:MFS transporter [Curtobacterium flaccumfaciens]|uniref:MFS transporter n=1 Tax=Curtobacterium flaccumfaciens TaxID=2035 RepID=UPI001366A4E1|nr:MFS transporter [Curtobacterium flaccumfaciens]MBT1666805.1 MFS transporter [Curtobacterium flaccumfaciens pv. flaccumfaciens]QFS80269.2 MFS transporter [Curtobacterium flaccumfaciens pv. flaccumfaciens]